MKKIEIRDFRMVIEIAGFDATVTDLEFLKEAQGLLKRTIIRYESNSSDHIRKQLLRHKL